MKQMEIALGAVATPLTSVPSSPLHPCRPQRLLLQPQLSHLPRLTTTCLTIALKLMRVLLALAMAAKGKFSSMKIAPRPLNALIPFVFPETMTGACMSAAPLKWFSPILPLGLLNNSDGSIECPGQFDMHCADDPVRLPLDPDQCQCDGQIWVNPEWNEGLGCESSLGSGGELTICRSGEIVVVDLQAMTLSCQDDNGNCPGGGGFTLGPVCEGIETTTATLTITLTTFSFTTTLEDSPDECVTTDDIPFGECDGCDGQVFINADCSQAFECLDSLSFPGDNDGCTFECNDGEIVLPDFSSGLYDCVDGSPDDLKSFT